MVEAQELAQVCESDAQFGAKCSSVVGFGLGLPVLRIGYEAFYE